MNFYSKFISLFFSILILGANNFIDAQLAQPIFRENATLISSFLFQNALHSGVQTSDGVSALNSILLTPATNEASLKNRKNSLSYFVNMDDSNFNQVRRDIMDLSNLIENGFINEKMNEIYKTVQDLIQTNGCAAEPEILNISQGSIGGRLKIIKDSFVYNLKKIKSFFGDIYRSLKNEKLTWIKKRDYICAKTLPLYFSFITINTIYRWIAIDGFKNFNSNCLVSSGVAALSLKYCLIAIVASLVGGYFAHNLSNGSASVVNMIAVVVAVAFDLITLVFKLPFIAVTKLSNFLRNVFGDGWTGSNLIAGVYAVELAKNMHPIATVKHASVIFSRLICSAYEAGFDSIFEMKKFCSKQLIGVVDAFSGVAAMIRESAKDDKHGLVSVVESDFCNKIKIKNAWDITLPDISYADCEFDGNLSKNFIAQLMLYNSLGAVFGSSDSNVKLIDFNSSLFFNAQGQIVTNTVNLEKFEPINFCSF